MKTLRVILPTIAFLFAAVAGVFASNLLLRPAYINRGTVANPIVQQVTVADNCVINSITQCTVTVSGVIYPTYDTAAGAATFNPAQLLEHP